MLDLRNKKTKDAELESQRKTILKQQEANTKARANQQKSVCQLKELKTIGILGKRRIRVG